MRKHTSTLIFSIFVFLGGCTTSGLYITPEDLQDRQAQRPSDTDLKHEVFLIGDAGDATSTTSEPALTLLSTLASRSPSNGTIVFLGDNIYCCGLPDSSSTSRAYAEMRLRAQLDAVSNYDGRVVFIPGNHDWGGNSIQRVDLVNRQERFVESYLDKGNVFLPDDGLPGPIDLKLEDGLRLVVLDTQWWMTDASKPFGESGGADIEEDADLILELEDVLRKRRKDDVLVVGHHPVQSNARHGGNFSFTDHLFPLTALADGLYIPLPVIGSLYPVFRELMGAPQDFSHPRYRSYRQATLALFQDHPGRLIYASGHEHSLQYLYEGHEHHLVSGAGSKAEFVASGGNARFTYNGEGFMRISFYANGEIWLDAWGADDDVPEGRLLYTTQMEGPSPVVVSEPVIVDNAEIPEIPAGTTVRRAVNPDLAAGPIHKLFFGSLNRKAWTQEIDFPVFDIGKQKGGLTPIRRGGSLQTTSVRLQNSLGRQFVLRSVSKDPTRSLPAGLEKTLAADVLIDQYSILHPYAAVIVPKLADGAGVYHANPTIVVVPDDPRFGPYRDLVANKVMLFEERPDEDMSHAESFGRSKNVIGTVSLLKKIVDDNDDRIDEQFYARARLFDMYLSDWDRHADQWRWAEFDSEDGNGKTYRVIPRDRDWAMGKMNGLFPTIAKSRFVLRKHQDLRESYGYIEGLTRNGGVLDRRITTSLSRNDWIQIAEDMQSGLTDNVIDAAIKDWPEPIQQLYEDEFRRVLRARRETLPKAAEDFYEVLSRFPDIVGSNKHERFEIKRLSGDRTEIVMYKTSKEGEIREELLRRIFSGKETDEVRLYGLGGNDVFEISGSAKKGVRIRAIGGPGEDRFIDNSGRGAPKNSFVIYDVPFQTEIMMGPTLANRLSSDPLVNLYDPYEYGYPVMLPTLFVGRNQEDGVFLGGGVSLTKFSFRKKPFDSQQTLRANLATSSQAFNIVYNGRFTERLGDWDLGLDLEARTPNNIRNYYGLGNESENTADEATFYQAKYSEVDLSLRLIKPIGDYVEFYTGPAFDYTDIKSDSTAFIGSPQAGITSESFADQTFLGIESGFVIDARDSIVYPKQGFLWQSGAHVRFGLDEISTTFTELANDFSFYVTPVSAHRLTFAARVGVKHNIGDFPFYKASTLGGQNTLRGFRSTRFAGRTAFYQNVELRTELFKYSTVVAVGSAGLLAFLDNGRVWTDGESSDKWHQGYGVGFWANLFDLSVLSVSVNFSDEESTLIIGLGLFY